MAEEKYVIVPQSDIDKLEKARIELHQMLDGGDVDTLTRLINITEPMWYLTHRRYPEAPTETK